MIYNASMATKWKVTSVSPADAASDARSGSGVVWRDTEESELEKLSRGATEVARESMKRIDAQKARACRKKMLQELMAAR